MSMTLLEECIQVLGENIEVLEEDDAKRIQKELEGRIPFTSYSRVDWAKIKGNSAVSVPRELLEKFHPEMGNIVKLSMNYHGNTQLNMMGYP